MSVRLMVEVWESDLPKNEKTIAVKMADFGNNDGTGIFPSVGRVAWETGYEDRQVQRIIKKLVKRGVLVHVGKHKIHNTNEYVLIVDALPKRPSWAEFCAAKSGGDKMSGGDIDDKKHRVTSASNGGDMVTPKPLLNPFLDPPTIQIALYFRFVDFWCAWFPNKPQPRKSNKTLRAKFKTRMENDDFVELWVDALKRAAESPALQHDSWFDAYYFLRNDDNFLKCYNRKWAWKDEQLNRKQRFQQSQINSANQRTGGAL